MLHSVAAPAHNKRISGWQKKVKVDKKVKSKRLGIQEVGGDRVQEEEAGSGLERGGDMHSFPAW